MMKIVVEYEVPLQYQEEVQVIDADGDTAGLLEMAYLCRNYRAWMEN